MSHKQFAFTTSDWSALPGLTGSTGWSALPVSPWSAQSALSASSDRSAQSATGAQGRSLSLTTVSEALSGGVTTTIACTNSGNAIGGGYTLTPTGAPIPILTGSIQNSSDPSSWDFTFSLAANGTARITCAF